VNSPIVRIRSKERNLTPLNWPLLLLFRSISVVHSARGGRRGDAGKTMIQGAALGHRADSKCVTDSLAGAASMG
jgi:hypothetical protein